MYQRTCHASAVLLIVLACALTLPAAPVLKPLAELPHDLIVALDVSASMVYGESSGEGNDPRGIRFDGLQFLIDTASDKDRFCLVLFSGDAAVPTQYIGDRKGFIQMDRMYYHPGEMKEVKGRQILKDLVKNLQEHETSWGRALRASPKDAKGNPKDAKVIDGFYTYNDLPALGKESFVLHNYTSVVETLNVITHKAGLLDHLSPDDRSPWLLLFTDGKDDVEVEGKDGLRFEEKGHHQYRPKPEDYAYLKAFKTEADRQRVLKEHLERLKSKRVRAFTFGLGDDCDKKLLQAITDGTNRQAEKTASQRIASSYHANTSIELLEQMKLVCWGLREYWVLERKPEQQAGRDVFVLPAPAPWRDHGVMLHRKPARNDVLLSAPRGADVAFEQGEAIKDLVPLTSRSHLYYRFYEADPKLAPDRPLTVVVKRSAAVPACECIGAVRTRQPLFVYQQPGTGSVFTPLDAIPFQVEFRPYEVNGKFPFSADQFEVRADLIPVAGKDSKPVYSVALGPDKVVPGQPATFRGELILDRKAERRDASLLGRYEVEVVIRGKEGKGPLSGATRHLVRASIEIADYPGLSVKQTSIRLGNKGGKPGALKAVVEVEIPGVKVGTKDNRVVAGIGSRLSGTWEQTGSDRSLDTAKAKLSATKVELRGGKGTVEVDLPPAALSGLALGEHTGGILTLRAPWGPERTVHLNLEKSRWMLESAPQPLLFVFDFSRRGEKYVSGRPADRIKGSLPSEETVWLSTSKDEKEKAGGSLSLEPEGGETISLRLEGLGKPVKFGPDGLTREGNALNFKLHRPERKLPFGKHQATLYLVGPAIEPLPVTVVVKRCKFKVTPEAVQRQITFDLSGRVKSEVVQPLKALNVRLVTDTDLPTDEEVWLSETKEPTGKRGDRELIFESVAKNTENSLKVRTSGLGKNAVVGNNSAAKSDPVSFALVAPSKDPPAGRYERKFWLVGEAIEPCEVTVKIQVNQPVVYLLDTARKRERERIPGLSFLGPAGTSISFRLQVDLEPKSASNPAWYTRLEEALRKARPRRDKGDELPVEVKGKGDLLEVKLDIPFSVHEGHYSTRLQANLSEDAAAPLLVDLPIHIQVVHFTAHLVEAGPLTLRLMESDKKPVEAGPLRLEPDKKSPALRAEGLITLTTKAELGQEVHWCVERVKQSEAGMFRPLDPNRLDVKIGDKPLKLDEGVLAGPNTPLKPGEKITLTVGVDCAGLAPGYYHASLRFPSLVNKGALEKVGKFSDEIKVEVIVPGRQVTVTQPTSKPAVGTAAPLRVVVTAYHCDVGTGQVFAADAVNNVTGKPVVIDASKQVKPDPVTKWPEGVRTVEFVVPVEPSRAGRNNFLVLWPRCLRANSGETGEPIPTAPKDQIARAVSIVALGRLTVTPAMAGIGEEVTIKAVINPDTVKANRTFALTGTAPGGSPIEVEMAAAKEAAIYTGKYRIREEGVFRLVSGAGGKVPLLPLQMRGSFELEQPGRDAKMLYGGGDVMRFIMGVWCSNLEQVSLPEAARLTNKDAGRCVWEARLVYPQRVAEAQTILQQGKDLYTIETRDFDVDLHLDSKLVVIEQPEGESSDVNERHKQGVLKNGQTLVLGVQSNLSTRARDQLYEDAPGEKHQSLDQLNGMLIELDLKWLDEDDRIIGQRVVRVPLAVQTQNWKLQGLLFGLINSVLLGMVAVGGWWTYRRLRPRKNQDESTGIKEDGNGEDSSEPTTQPTAPAELPPGWEE